MTDRTEPIPVYVYARVSTYGQDRKLSREEQEEFCRELAPKYGYDIIHFFREVASATGTEKRPVFREMMSLATSPRHPVGALLFHDLSRAFRDDEDYYINRRILREANVDIHTVEEGLLTEDDDSQLRFGFKSLLNSQSPRKTSRETRRGQFGATRRGYYIGPDVFGYEKYKVKVSDDDDDDDEEGGEGGEGDVKGKGKRKRKQEHTKLRPHPTQWEHLLTMRRMALENHSATRIADHLKDLGVKTVRDKDFTEGAVLYALRNPISRGKTHRGENSSSRYLDRSDQAHKDNAHEAALSEDDYNLIEDLIRLRTTAPGGPRAHSSPNPLSGHVKCGLCGWNMTLSRSKGITRLICSNKRKNKVKGCPGKNVPLDVLVPRVIAALLYQILTEQNVRQQVTLVRETNRETLEEQQADRETILGNIKGTKEKISNLVPVPDSLVDTGKSLPTVDSSLRGNDVQVKRVSGIRHIQVETVLVDTIETRGGNPQLYERLDKREDELKKLEVQLGELDESAQDQLEFLNNPERIVACALDMRTYIESEDPEIARMFILSFINKVVVQGKQAIIHYRIPLPRDPKGNPNPTETVSLKKGAESKSCLSPAHVGIHQGAALLQQAGNGPGLRRRRLPRIQRSRACPPLPPQRVDAPCPGLRAGLCRRRLSHRRGPEPSRVHGSFTPGPQHHRGCADEHGHQLPGHRPPPPQPDYPRQRHRPAHPV